MLRRLALRDFVIVRELDVEPGSGFSVLTGETGAGKSILIDALQLALGNRSDAGVVREGASRAEVSAEFDTPAALLPWLEEAGFDAADSLLLRRTVDAEGRSRAWINGSPATVTQLRQAADALVEIHGQHAWQGLTRPAAVRALLDAQAGVDGAAMARTWQAWRETVAALELARSRHEGLERERERLQWQISELERLSPTEGEWVELDAEHRRLANAQSLIEGARLALECLSDAEPAADSLCARATDALESAAQHDVRLSEVLETVQSAQAQLQDASRTLHGYLAQAEPDPQRLSELDSRMSAWLQLARRYRRPPPELPALLQGWREELKALDAAADLETLERSAAAAEQAWRHEAKAVSAARKAAAGPLAAAVTQAMQTLGMEGGRFEVALLPAETPHSGGLETVEFLVAGHAGSSPRPVAKVASGGELSRLALAIAVTTARQRSAAQAVGTLIFDEIDAGVGGTVADTVGRLLKQLGAQVQVLAVTHLAQVAACADAHFVVSKEPCDGGVATQLRQVTGEARVAEVARMLGGERLTGTSRAHAQAMLGDAP